MEADRRSRIKTSFPRKKIFHDSRGRGSSDGLPGLLVVTAGTVAEVVPDSVPDRSAVGESETDSCAAVVATDDDSDSGGEEEGSFFFWMYQFHRVCASTFRTCSQFVLSHSLNCSNARCRLEKTGWPGK